MRASRYQGRREPKVVTESGLTTRLFRGKIVNLRCWRRKHDFVLSEAKHTYLEATAAGAAVLGMGASAIGLLQMSANSEEEADWVEFELDGKRVEGWLWKLPMFSCYGWRDVSKIDLARASKDAMPVNARPDEFGIYYFHYNPDSTER